MTTEINNSGQVSEACIDVELYDQLVELVKRLEFEKDAREKLQNQIKSSQISIGIVSRAAAYHPPENTLPADVEALTQLKVMQQHINKAGWVETEGKYLKSWRKRWFVLRGASLVYFESLEKMIHSGNKLRGDVRLDSDCQITYALHANGTNHTLTVEGDGKKLSFSATLEELNDWRNALRAKVACLHYLKAFRNRGETPEAPVLRFINNELLTKFSFSGVQLRGDGCRALSACIAYHQKLEELDLSRSGLTDETLTILCDAFNSNSRLVSIDLSHNLLTAKSCGLLTKALGTTPRVLSDAIITPVYNDFTRNLAILRLDGNMLTDTGVSELSNLLTTEYLPKLTELSLNDVGMQDAGAVQFSQALYKRQRMLLVNKEFPSLRLANNKIGDDGVVALCGVLEHSSVTQINLSDNKIGDRGIGALAAQLPLLPKLLSIEIQGNSFSDTGLSEVLKGLLRSSAITRAHLTTDHLLESEAMSALRLVLDADVISRR
eukprot:c18079_g1_i1.p1 GENE.c18079_g1_i1~~c18079_g1_i1.p1  ORF type:complete len:538 (+),score=119.40 c18079_g1_i1:137-1615(+)